MHLYLSGDFKGKHMEVLKHGKVYEEDIKARTVTCECGCEFRFEGNDIVHKITPTMDYDPLMQNYINIHEYIVKCPECGENKDVTEYIEAKARL